MSIDPWHIRLTIERLKGLLKSDPWSGEQETWRRLLNHLELLLEKMEAEDE